MSKEESTTLDSLRQALKEAMDRQEATAEILRVAASFPSSPQPVFDSIVKAGQKLFPNAIVSIALQVKDEVRVVAIAGPNEADVEAWRERFPAPLKRDTMHGFVIMEGQRVDVPSVADETGQFSESAKHNFLASGYQAVTMMPLSLDETAVGALAVLRSEKGRLSDQQFALLETFSSQASLALKNTQRINELRETNTVLEAVSTQLARYIPPQLYHSIMRGEKRAAIETRRKKLTIFFSDIVDFTEITDQLEAEELTALLNEYLSEMAKIAQHHGAYFDKFIGDAMMFHFGDSESRGAKEDATACVKMAIAMQRKLAQLQAGWRKKGLIDRPFEARIGINTGYCTIGNFGSDDRMDYTIIGREVNLAARLESQADAGGILLAAETYALVNDWVSVEERAAVHVKGFANPVQTYSVTGIHDEAQDASRVIHFEEGGLSLTFDRDKLTDKEKPGVVRFLNSILSDLKE